MWLSLKHNFVSIKYTRISVVTVSSIVNSLVYVCQGLSLWLSVCHDLVYNRFKCTVCNSCHHAVYDSQAVIELTGALSGETSMLGGPTRGCTLSVTLLLTRLK